MSSSRDTLLMLGLAPVRGKAQRRREAGSEETEEKLGV